MVIFTKPNKKKLIIKAQNCKRVNKFSYVTKNRFGKYKKIYYFDFKNNNVLFKFLENPLRNYLIKQEFFSHYTQSYNLFYQQIVDSLNGLDYEKIKQLKPVFTVKAKREILRNLVFNDENNLLYFTTNFTTSFEKEQIDNFKLTTSYAHMLYEIKHNKKFIDDVLDILENNEYDSIDNTTLQGAIAKRYYKHYRLNFIPNLVHEIALYEARNKAQEYINLELTTANNMLKNKVSVKFDTIKRILYDRINITERVVDSFKSSEASHFIWTLDRIINDKAKKYKTDLYKQSFQHISKKLFSEFKLDNKIIDDFTKSYEYINNFEIALLEYNAEIKTILTNSIKINKLEHDAIKIKRINEKYGFEFINVSKKVNKIFNLKTTNEILLKTIESFDKEKSIKNVMGSVSSNLLLLNEAISKKTNYNQLNIYDFYTTNINNIKFETSIKRYAETSKMINEFSVLNSTIVWFTNQNKFLSVSFAKTENELLSKVVNKLNDEHRNAKVRVLEIINSYGKNQTILSSFVKSFVSTISSEIEKESCASVRYSKLVAFANNLTEKGVISSNDEFVKAVEMLILKHNTNYQAVHILTKFDYPIFNYKRINLYDIINYYLKYRPIKTFDDSIDSTDTDQLKNSEEEMFMGVDSSNAVKQKNENEISENINENIEESTNNSEDNQEPDNEEYSDNNANADNKNIDVENADENAENLNENKSDDLISENVASIYEERDPQVVKAIEKMNKNRQYVESYTTDLMQSFKSVSLISPEIEKTLNDFYSQNSYTDENHALEEESQQQYYNENGMDVNSDSDFDNQGIIDSEIEASESLDEKSTENIAENSTENMIENTVENTQEISDDFENEIIAKNSNENSNESITKNLADNSNENLTETLSAIESINTLDKEVKNSAGQTHNNEDFDLGADNDNETFDLGTDNESLYHDNLYKDENLKSSDEDSNDDEDTSDNGKIYISADQVQIPVNTNETDLMKNLSNSKDTHTEKDMNKLSDESSNFGQSSELSFENQLDNITKKDEEILSDYVVKADELFKKTDKDNDIKFKTYNLNNEKDANACKNDIFWKMQLMAINQKIKLEDMLDSEDLEDFKSYAPIIKLFEIAGGDNLNLSEVVLEKLGRLTFQQLARLSILKYNDGKMKDKHLKDIINHLFLNALAYSKSEEYKKSIMVFLQQKDVANKLENGLVSLNNLLAKETVNGGRLKDVYDYIYSKTAPIIKIDNKKTIDKNENDGIIV